ncbi:MmcQ/YjbR family DNA-binding protein [Bizionia sp. KMM 8389]
MNIEELRNYCLSKKGATEHFPFDEDVLVFKVGNKMFLLTSLKNWEQEKATINVKCDPDYALELRATYKSVIPGFHMNKKHWNTVSLFNGDLSVQQITQMIDESYELIVKSLTKKVRNSLG